MEKSLHRHCIHREQCWDHAKDRFPPPEDGSEKSDHISRPWVGSGYKDLKLVVVGINMNEAGGFNKMVDLVEKARIEIQEGRRRVRFGHAFKDYPGTFLFHRVGAYAAILAEVESLLHLDWESDGFPCPRYIEEGFNFIALTNHVKCSPMGKVSTPTAAMWKNCGRHILRLELGKLLPQWILVLGTSENRRIIWPGHLRRTSRLVGIW